MSHSFVVRIGKRGASSLPECGEVLKIPTRYWGLLLVTPDGLCQCPIPPFLASSSLSAASSVMSEANP